MGRPLTIFCDSADLAVECAQRAADLDLPVEPRVVGRPLVEPRAPSDGSPVPVGLALSKLPDVADLVTLSVASGGTPPALALIGCGSGTGGTVALARDLGIAAVTEVRPLLAALALVKAGAERPWAASARGLPDPDRARIASALRNTSRQGGQLVPMGGGSVGFSPGHGEGRMAGEPRDVAEAIVALRESAGAGRAAMPSVEGVSRQAVLDVIFGPARALSDPASKAALAPYDLPLPIEELCTSASRAAAEAARIGFPVRIALASPDLRVADHPDLSMDGIDNAARVREVYRQLTAMGRSRLPSARLLGVTVSATTPAHALVRVRITPLPEGLARCDLAFADPHGLASEDATCTVLPAPPARLEQALGRLAGSPLLLQGTAADRRRTVTALLDVLLRAAAFVHDFRTQVDAVTLDPLALLIGGGIEVREACVMVGDAFERSLAAAPGEAAQG